MYGILWGMTIRSFLTLLLMFVILVSCCPPPVTYPSSPLVTRRRALLRDNLVKLLPSEQQSSQDAQQEATWLADTAYKAAAGISRVNNSNFPGWAGNALVNIHLQDRGLCWHYQHDMFRELRRRPLHFFRIGCCVRDKNERSEHNCVYVAAINDPWPKAWVLDAWMWNGRLKVNYAPELDQDDWKDLPNVTGVLQTVYPEAHHYPIEHWFMVRYSFQKYGYSSLPEHASAPQTIRMFQNITDGTVSHPGKLTNY